MISCFQFVFIVAFVLLWMLVVILPIFVLWVCSFVIIAIIIAIIVIVSLVSLPFLYGHAGPPELWTLRQCLFYTDMQVRQNTGRLDCLFYTDMQVRQNTGRWGCLFFLKKDLKCRVRYRIERLMDSKIMRLSDRQTDWEVQRLVDTLTRS